MEPRTLIGIVVVAGIGVGLAAVVAFSLGPAMPAASPTRTVTTPSGDVIQRPAPPEARRSTSTTADESETGPAKVATPRPRREEVPIPEGDARALGALLHRVEQLRNEPVFQTWTPDTPPELVREQLDGAVADVEEIGASYVQLARETDSPQLASEAYHQAAMAYELLSEQIPPELPGTDPEIWQERRSELLDGLRTQAEAYRADAERIAREDEP